MAILNELTKAITNKFNIQVDSILIGKKYLRPVAHATLKELVKKIHTKQESIFNYVRKEESLRIKRWECEVETSQFKLGFYILPDLSTELMIKYSEVQTAKFNDMFIKSKVDPEMSSFVYFIKSDYGFKIGKTKDLNNRLNVFGVKLPFKVELHSYIETIRMNDCESFFHQVFYDRQINGEWFNLDENDLVLISMLSRKFGTYKKITNG